MVYEIGIHESEGGRADVMRCRFRDSVATRLLAGRGVELPGIFTAQVVDDCLGFITRSPDEYGCRYAPASLLKNSEVSVRSTAQAGLPPG